MNAWPDAVLTDPADVTLRILGSEEAVPLPARRWHAPVPAEEVRLLGRATSPVLDVGCGPGRHAAALLDMGHRALGIDSSPAAVRSARRRGAAALNVSVFGPVPAGGLWATALLLDGNIGIGGDPVRLLCRIRVLLRPGGSLLAELDPPGVPSRRFHARVLHASGSGPKFPWAQVSATAIAGVAAEAGLSTDEIWEDGDRWFAEIRRPAP